MGTILGFNFPFARMAVAVALSGIGGAAGAQPAQPSEATVGDITFNHDAAAWRIVPEGDKAVATCLAVDCPGVVIDISHRPSAGECTKSFVAETAQQLFPQADRHAVNTLAAGRFGLVLAASRRGPDFGVPTYVFACLDWQGRDYRFETRPETVGDSSWTAGALHNLVSRASAPAARVDTLAIGAMTLEIPTDVWNLAMLVSGRAAMLTCRPPTCRDDGPMVIVSARGDDEPPENHVPEAEDDWTRDTRVRHFTGEDPAALTFTVTTTYSPCRNYVPPTVAATTRHGDTTYRIASTATQGCQSTGKVPAPVFEALLASARIAP